MFNIKLNGICDHEEMLIAALKAAHTMSSREKLYITSVDLSVRGS